MPQFGAERGPKHPGDPDDGSSKQERLCNGKVSIGVGQTELVFTDAISAARRFSQINIVRA